MLRPGGTLVGSDSVHSVELHHFHEGDVYNPIDPGTLFTRLQTIGFDYITVVSSGACTSAPASRRVGLGRPWTVARGPGPWTVARATR